MSTSICTACLSRLRISASMSKPGVFAVPRASSFHSSATQNNVIKKKSGPVQTAKYRESRGAKIKKKNKSDRPKPPAPGERRAQRKRIVLSNTNAFEVPALEHLSVENMTSQEKLGQMLALNGALLDQLREVKAFKTTQNWSMFRAPSTLMRQESVELGRDIEAVNASTEDQGLGAQTIHKVITGDQGSGKSIHLLQAMSMAFLNKWIVINIPECQDFVLNHSSYAPVVQDANNASNGEQTYIQPHLTSEILQRLVSANTPILSSLKVSHNHGKSLPVPTKRTMTLKELAQHGADQPSIAVPIFSAVWKELTVPGTSEGLRTPKVPPMLVAIDGLNHWMGPTKYRSSEHKVIHAHQFQLIRHFLSVLFSRQANPLPYGGMVLAATSASNSPDYPSFTTLLQQLQAKQDSDMKTTDPGFPLPSPYSKTDPRVQELIKDAGNTGITELKGLSKGESKGLLEYFAQSGILQQKITDGFIGEQWSLSGGGVVGEMCKFGKRIRV